MTSGDKLFYDAVGGTKVGGLDDKKDYFAIVLDANTIKLASSHTDATDSDGAIAIDLTAVGSGTQKLMAEGQSLLTFDPTLQLPVDLATDRITIVAHGFKNDAEVVYLNGGGTDIGGLANGTTYFVKVVDTETIELAASAGGTKIDLTSRGTGLRHGLERAAVLTVADAPIRGLEDSEAYFVTRIDDNTIRLAKRSTKAAIDLSTTGAAATGHQFSVHTGSGIKILANLEAANTAKAKTEISTPSNSAVGEFFGKIFRGFDYLTKGELLADFVTSKLSKSGSKSDASKPRQNTSKESESTINAAAGVAYQTFTHTVMAHVGTHAVLKSSSQRGSGSKNRAGI